jgi:hypothetical protein
MTNNFPNIGKKTYGRDFNFYQKLNVTATDFGSNSVNGVQPDMVITFPTQTVMFLNESTVGVVEYSFNGTTVHGELDPTLISKSLTFDDRVISLIWFKLKAGNAGPVTIRVDAWSTR